MTDTVLLAAAAFGEDPGRWPLPEGTTPQELWLRAVAAGGQGRYGAARADLAGLRRIVSSGRLASLACSTQGSHIRQLGGHAEARRWDSRALALAATDPEARIDALLGLGADALGMCRFAASAALLARSRALLAEAGFADRIPVRWHWVAAELAIVSGDGTAAVRYAEQAVELAAVLPSARHRAKSQAIYAAALCSGGHIDRARTVADELLPATAQLGLTPLGWAAVSLLADIGSNVYGRSEVIALRDECAATVRRHGGVWSR